MKWYQKKKKSNKFLKFSITVTALKNRIHNSCQGKSCFHATFDPLIYHTVLEITNWRPQSSSKQKFQIQRYGRQICILLLLLLLPATREPVVVRTFERIIARLDSQLAGPIDFGETFWGWSELNVFARSFTKRRDATIIEKEREREENRERKRMRERKREKREESATKEATRTFKTRTRHIAVAGGTIESLFVADPRSRV